MILRWWYMLFLFKELRSGIMVVTIDHWLLTLYYIFLFFLLHWDKPISHLDWNCIFWYCWKDIRLPIRQFCMFRSILSPTKIHKHWPICKFQQVSPVKWRMCMMNNKNTAKPNRKGNQLLSSSWKSHSLSITWPGIDQVILKQWKSRNQLHNKSPLSY